MSSEPHENKLRLLSPREMEIVQCLVQGLTNREIADHIGLSQHTVKNYLFRIFEKLGVSSRVELLFLALDESSGRPTEADTAGLGVKVMADGKLPDKHDAAEWARFVRELLDGAVRSLIAVEMQIDVLRRQAEANRPIGAELGRIQSLLREEVLKLRELMQHEPLIRGAVSSEPKGLTPRELEIVSAVAAGYSNKEIAEYFKISEDTLKHHLWSIFEKLGVSSRLELTLYWLDKKRGGPEGGEGGPEGGDAAGIAVIKPRRPNLNRGSAAAKLPGWPQA